MSLQVVAVECRKHLTVSGQHDNRQLAECERSRSLGVDPEPDGCHGACKSNKDNYCSASLDMQNSASADTWISLGVQERAFATISSSTGGGGPGRAVTCP